MCTLFGVLTEEGQDFPVAALTRVIDDEQSLQGTWMRADPVHLVANIDGIGLMDSTTFNLDQHDALVLAAGVRNVLLGHGLSLEAPTPGRWYIRLDKMPGISTTPIHEVAGRNIQHHMPVGKDQAAWRSLINEIQMAMHANPINEERQLRGEVPVNSVWFWGCGSLPEQPDIRWTRVFSDEETAKALARHARTTYSELPETAPEIVEGAGDSDDILAVISFGQRHAQYHSLAGWQDFISYLEECWFALLLGYLQSGALERLTVLTGELTITLTRWSRYRIWNRPRSIRRYSGQVQK